MIYIWSGLSAAPNIFSANDRNMSMNYANIKYYDIANGPGVRTSVFVSGRSEEHTSNSSHPK